MEYNEMNILVLITWIVILSIKKHLLTGSDEKIKV